MPAPNEIWLVTNEWGEICMGLMGSGVFHSASEAGAFAAEQNKLEDGEEVPSKPYTAHRFIRIANTPTQLSKPPKGQIGQ